VQASSLIKSGLWLYFVLLIAEGALRKWVLPELSNPLLIIRDPVVIGIYLVALASGLFPWRPAVLILLGFGTVSVAFATLSSTPWEVVLYGLRINYLHIPLIFVMGLTFDREDVIRIGRATLWLTLPITALMLLQFNAGEGSWLNVGAGGGLDAQIRGAMGKVRPPGPFSFITGPILWFSLATAFTFYGWLHAGTYPRWLVVVCTAAIVVAVPVSISRMLLLSVGVVIGFGALTLLRDPRKVFGFILPLFVVALVLGFIGESELTGAFSARWDESIGTGVKESIFGRFFNDYGEAFAKIVDTPLSGYGIGMGSNVGAKFLGGEMGFLLAEAEWPKTVLELGPLLGTVFLLYRCWLALQAVLIGWRTFIVENDSLAWLLCGACVLPILSGQWAPPTVLGFAVFGGGLVLAAANNPTPPVTTEDEHEDLVITAPVP
jgi:hypothetical protein